MQAARQKIARTLTRLAGLIGALIALTFPCTFFIAAYSGMSGTLQARAEAFAITVNRLVSSAPDMWQYQHYRLEVQLQRLLQGQTTERARILDANGGLVVETGSVPPAPTMVRSALVYDAGIPVGRIEVSDTLRELLLGTAAAALAGLLLAGAIFVIVRSLPLKALDRALADLAARQAEIRRLNEELEDRVRDRTQALRDTVEQLEAFSYSVAHDLRAPIRSINSFSHLAMKTPGTVLDADGRRYLERVIAASDRMAVLIDDLLDLARVSRSELKRERVDLTGLARAVMAELTGSQPSRSVCFEADADLYASADAALMRLVLANLLDNALKFTARTAQARIEFRAVEEEEGRRMFVIRDNGVGFDMRYAHKLFGTFQRLHNPGDFPGTGIGLATVQRIVARHGGTVRLESEVGKGTAVYFTV